MVTERAMEVSGVLLLSFGRACVNLSIVLGPEVEQTLQSVAPDGWYPYAHHASLCDQVAHRYADPGPILERIGAETMRIWYELGPGRQFVQRGVDFLHFQAGSQGYQSVVRGEPDAMGYFRLESISEADGRATMRTTCPFPWEFLRGILSGGMGLTGDLGYVDVRDGAEPHVFEIEFH